MAIETTCSSCGKVLKARDEMAGRTAKCPDCGAPVRLPGLSTERSADAGSGEMSASDGSRRSCPHCGEMIRASATICRYCNRDVSGSPAGRPAVSTPVGPDEMAPLDWVLCILCSGIGCIVGIVKLCQGKPKSGGLMIGISVGMSILASIAWFILMVALGMSNDL